MDSSAPRRVTPTTVMVALATILLIVPEIWLAAAALLWGLHIVLHLPPAGDVALGAALALPALWATWHVARLAFEAETDPENAL